ncbi:MAG TPA: sugar phosphate isomerase/epimerase family protein [Terriglobia bacterium]|nr:sugar phosphate isomerase/epimerase family protein [Terriglobia bacterium]
MSRPSRREFLGHASLLAAAFCPAALSHAAGPRQPHLDFPTAPRDRLSVTSYPFREFIVSPTNGARDPKKPGMDLKEFPGMIAKKFGVHNINPLLDHFSSTAPAYLDAFRQAVADAGSHMTDLGLGGRRFWDPDSAQRQAAVDYGKHGIEMALAVGSPSVRQHLGGSRGMQPDVDLAAKSLGKLADYGASQNVVVLLENDAAINEDPLTIVKIIEKVDNPYLRALPDLGNSLEGGDADFNQRGVTGMFQHAFNMSHVKDEVMGAGGKTYKVDLPALFAVAKDSGYKGYFSMEFEIRLADPYAGTQRLIDETLKYLA